MGFIRALGSGEEAGEHRLSTVPESTSAAVAVLPAAPGGSPASHPFPAHQLSESTLYRIPPGFALVVLQEERVVACVAAVGTYSYSSDEEVGHLLIGGESILPLLKASWQRFGGTRLSAQKRLAFFVRMGDLVALPIVPKQPVRWEDTIRVESASAQLSGSYTLRVMDPILFMANFLPLRYTAAGARPFDLTEADSPAVLQLTHEVEGALASAFSSFVNDDDMDHHLLSLRNDTGDFTLALSRALEHGHGWAKERGLALCGVTFARLVVGNEVVVAEDEVSASPAVHPLAAAMPSPAPSVINAAPAADGTGAIELPPMERLLQFKAMLDGGLITEAEYTAAKAKLLGL
jgi:hypothetical protein